MGRIQDPSDFDWWKPYSDNFWISEIQQYLSEKFVPKYRSWKQATDRYYREQATEHQRQEWMTRNVGSGPSMVQVYEQQTKIIRQGYQYGSPQW